jgi:hypothetical protein
MAGIKIKAEAGTGSTELQGPANTNNVTTLKLPSSDGTADQLLKTDGSGNLGWATDQGGQILQVKSVSIKDHQSTTADSSDSTGSDKLIFHTWATLITGFSITITPADNTNKILIMYDVALGSTTRYSAIGITRTPAGGSEVPVAVGNQDGSNRRRVTKGSPHNSDGGTHPDYENPPTVAGTYLDDPQSDVALTYKVYCGNVAENQNSHTTHINRGPQQASNDSDWASAAISTLTIMEISA